MPKSHAPLTQAGYHPYSRSGSSNTHSDSDVKPSLPPDAPQTLIPSATPAPPTTPTKPNASQGKAKSTPTEPSTPKRKATVQPTGSSGQRSPASPTKAWTGPELLAVFRHALIAGPPGSDTAWEGVVPGRNGNSTRLAWRKRVKPMLEAYLLSQGK